MFYFENQRNKNRVWCHTQVYLSEHHNMVFRQTLVERDRCGNLCIIRINQLWATAHSDQGRSPGHHLTSVAATCPQPRRTCGLPIEVTILGLDSIEATTQLCPRWAVNITSQNALLHLQEE